MRNGTFIGVVAAVSLNSVHGPLSRCHSFLLDGSRGDGLRMVGEAVEMDRDQDFSRPRSTHWASEFGGVVQGIRRRRRALVPTAHLRRALDPHGILRARNRTSWPGYGGGS
jgi:hypothetical protein